jgi:hypothetical protein
MTLGFAVAKSAVEGGKLMPNQILLAFGSALAVTGPYLFSAAQGCSRIFNDTDPEGV